jgi:hypothetical protein
VLSNGARIILLGCIILVSVYMMCKDSDEPYSNEGVLTDEESALKSSDDVQLAKKMITNNTATHGYKHSSYDKGHRGGQPMDIDRFFEQGNPYGDMDYAGFASTDASKGNLATYKAGKPRKLTVDDKFNATELLPNEANKDWFEDVQATSIKNPHMINIYRPIGVNTISTTLKNPSHDIRGTPPNPRNFVSPWNMSSIEPDLNIRDQSLCY